MTTEKINVLALAAAVFMTVGLSGQPAASRKHPESSQKSEFDRAQFMIMNLNRGKDSTGYYLQESVRQGHSLEQALSRAQHQLEQVEKAYAKSRGRPDDKYLTVPAARIAACRTAAANLVKELQTAHQELAASIHEVLLMDK